MLWKEPLYFQKGIKILGSLFRLYHAQEIQTSLFIAQQDLPFLPCSLVCEELWFSLPAFPLARMQRWPIHSFFLGDLVFPHILLLHSLVTIPTLSGTFQLTVPPSYQWLLLTPHGKSCPSSLLSLPAQPCYGHHQIPLTTHLTLMWSPRGFFEPADSRHPSWRDLLEFLWERLPPHLQRLESCASSPVGYSRCLKLFRRNSCLYLFLRS